MRMGFSGSVPTTAAGKWSITRYLGMPPKKAHAASRPAMTSPQLLLLHGPDEAVAGVAQHD